MNSETQTAPAPAALDPAPLAVASRNWTRWLGPGISCLILGAVLYQLRSIDLAELWRILPVRIDFWIAFIAVYMATPVADWVIFRGLWKLPARGIAALMRKQVSNEILLGYLGEVYFYAWARRNSSIAAAPFGAIKDVTILSALTGNIVTLGLLLVCWPYYKLLQFNSQDNGVEWSIAFVIALSLGITLLRRRLFSLPPRQLWFVTGVHIGRIVAALLLTSFAWFCLMPGIGLAWLLLLSTMRMLLSRLPFLPNKDLTFAALTAFIIGNDNVVVPAMALMASLFLAAHLVVGAVLGAAELFKEGRANT